MRSTTKNRSKALYHVNRGIVAYASGDMSALAEYVETVTRLVEGWSEGKGYSLYLHALLARAAGDTSRYGDLIENALEEMSMQGNIRAEAQILLTLSSDMSDLRAALKHARRSLRRFESCDDRVGISNACINVSLIQLQLGRHDEGHALLEKVLRMKRELGDRYGLGMAIVNIASFHINQGNYNDGLLRATEGVTLFEHLHEMTPSNCTSLVWQTNGWISVETRCEFMLATACNNLGNVLDYLGEPDRAIQHYIRGRELMCAIGNLGGEAMILNQIGDLFREKGEYVRAEEYFRRSLGLFEKKGTRGYMYGIVLQSIGESCAAQGRNLEALEQYCAAREEFGQSQHTMGEVEVLLLTGELMIAMGDYANALPSLKEGLELAQSISARELVVRCNRGLGSAFMYIDSVKAREFLNRALGQSEEYAMKLEQKNIHRELASYYELVGDSTNALAHFKKFHDIKEVIFTENADRRLKNFEILHRVEQYKQSLAAMASKVERIEAELEEKKRELVSLAARIMEKQEFVKLVRNGLMKLIEAHPDKKNSLAKELLNSLKKMSDAKSDWEELTKKFLSLHRVFAGRLMEIAPTLTEREFQICVLLRLAMGAKQIADILGVTAKNIFNHQQSIRRKLGLFNGENLKTFMIRMDVIEEKDKNDDTNEGEEECDQDQYDENDDTNDDEEEDDQNEDETDNDN